ncbi:MAG: DNA mismatch repair endonuclease MutL [Chitinophagaceae bacterium]|jgi:DNA mismatch repair protein MutL
MPNSIHVLPVHIANQIAAGEVIQRPSSAVKELLENAVDAGATDIQLVIEDAGKSLVQVIDNGKGMGAEDAVNCFQRHATSKIGEIEDLFRIKTMGFRGEALASIAAVAQVALKTRPHDQELGTAIELENSVITSTASCACSAGTSISMKNLFFNVPARRNFLKSNTVELRHITDEFLHVALAFPEVSFSMTSNGQESYHLDKGTLKQRIVQVMGNSYASRLVQVEEKTDYLNVTGFIGKPDTARKTRGEQYLFVNRRFIRSAYLNHAIVTAYEELLPQGSFPFFVLFIELDPAHIDINVHPTKQEIKFDDDKIVYAFIKSAIRHALAQFSIAPALDFELDPSIQQLDAVSKPFTADQQQQARSGGLYKTFVDSHQAHRIESSSNLKNWKDFFETAPKETSAQQGDLEGLTVTAPMDSPPLHSCLHVQKTYIVTEAADGVRLIHHQLAHQQILFEKFNKAWEGAPIAIQRALFPQAIHTAPSDEQLLESIRPDLLQMGYELESFGKNSFLLNGTPADHPNENSAAIIEMILEDVKDATSKLHSAYRERIAKALARKHAVRPGTSLTATEMHSLVEQLFNCKQSKIHFDGRPIYMQIGNQQLYDVFGS